MFGLFKKSVDDKLVDNKPKGLGLDLKPGDDHYRAYVGPPKDYDLVSAMVFNLLTCVGLRQHHKLLDIGCGSLRVGRLLIPYLNKGNYFGVEPNRWLVQDGIDNEMGTDLVRIKDPSFIFDDSLKSVENPLEIDFAFAQSTFSHCGKDLLTDWLKQMSFHLKNDGALLATFLVDEKDYEQNGWVYPGCVKYTTDTMAEIAKDSGLDFTLLDWAHPRQSWAVFSKPGFDKSLVTNNELPSWNRFVKSLD